MVRDRARTKRSVVLALDVSGSMRGERVTMAAATVAAMATELERDALAVIAFWSDAAVLLELGQPVHPMALLDSLLALPAQGLTNVAFPLQVAARQLLRVPAADARVVLALGLRAQRGARSASARGRAAPPRRAARHVGREGPRPRPGARPRGPRTPGAHPLAPRHRAGDRPRVRDLTCSSPGSADPAVEPFRTSPKSSHSTSSSATTRGDALVRRELLGLGKRDHVTTASPSATCREPARGTWKRSEHSRGGEVAAAQDVLRAVRMRARALCRWGISP